MEVALWLQIGMRQSPNVGKCYQKISRYQAENVIFCLKLRLGVTKMGMLEQDLHNFLDSKDWVKYKKDIIQCSIKLCEEDIYEDGEPRK